MCRWSNAGIPGTDGRGRGGARRPRARVVAGRHSELDVHAARRTRGARSAAAGRPGRRGTGRPTRAGRPAPGRGPGPSGSAGTPPVLAAPGSRYGSRRSSPCSTSVARRLVSTWRGIPVRTRMSSKRRMPDEHLPQHDHGPASRPGSPWPGRWCSSPPTTAAPRVAYHSLSLLDRLSKVPACWVHDADAGRRPGRGPYSWSDPTINAAELGRRSGLDVLPGDRRGRAAAAADHAHAGIRRLPRRRGHA